MNGLALSRAYYEIYGREMILGQFPEYAGRIAVGLAGEGSECFGYDDELSQDHDFGPSFCMWLTDDDYGAVGARLQEAYDALPKEFWGFRARAEEPYGQNRVGALRISDFYRKFIGRADAEITPLGWLYIPESHLATATNGEVFCDGLGAFSAIREKLLRFYPEDVRLKKIAARAAVMGQAGQYNYARCMARGEAVAAQHAISEFIENTISIIFLLNRRYKPYYKWMHRAMRELPALGEAGALLYQLALNPLPMDAWGGGARRELLMALNAQDANVMIIERICRLVTEELRRQGLTDRDDSFITNHAASVISRIKDPQLMAMHIMEG
jgi:hypothetical protein